MAVYAIVVDGVVVNLAEADHALEPNWIESDTARIGATYDGTTFVNPTVVPVNSASVLTVPAWKVKAELLALGRLTEANALVAGIGGELELRWEYGPDYDRSFPAWDQFGAMMNPPLSAADIDEIFMAANART